MTVTGVDDSVDDGNVAYTIVTAAATSSDGSYNGINPADVSVTNVDDETAGVTVSAPSGPTTEAGGTATFTIVLNSQPTAGVTIGLSSNDTSEGTVSPSSVTFTAGNWSTPQTVTVTGVDDYVDDDNVTYTIVTAAATSSDPKYTGFNAADVSVTNVDDETAGFLVSPASGPTTEAGGTATFSIVLTSQPTASVTVGLSSSDPSEGALSVPSVTFTTGNWNTPQTVTVTGVNDDIDDDNVGYSAVTAPATSSDSKYSNLDPADVALTNLDDADLAGINVSPTSGLVTNEGGAFATFTIVLNSQPTAGVTISLSSSDTSEGTVSPSSVSFTAGTWNVAQTVTVTGVNDDIDDDNVGYSIVTAAATSGDAKYSGMNPSDVSVTNNDDGDTAGITVSPTTGLTTTEGGGQASFSVVLTSQPTASVTIGISSSDASEGTVSASTLVFTAGNWSTAQTVTVTGVDDAVDDDNVGYSIVTAAATSIDAKYNGMNPPNVSVTNNDDDTAGFTVAPTSGLTTTEAGGIAQFTVVLNSQPTADVTVALTSNNTNEGTVSPSSLTFTAASWSSPQTVFVTGVDDDVDDDGVDYSIVTAPATSSDGKYSGINPSNVSVTNLDDDVAGVTVSPKTGLTTTEAGGTAAFTVRLDTQPTASVSMTVTSTDTGEGTVSTASLTFTTGDWSTPQTVTVTGVDDALADGDVPYEAVIGTPSSSDPKYSALGADTVSLTNLDDDSPGILVNPTSGLTTTEAGGTATFTIVLNQIPTADVTVPLSSSDTSEGTVSPSSVTFTTLNWNTPQTVTITGQNDSYVDGDVPYAIVTGAATSTDGTYGGVDPSDVSVTNDDDEAAGFTVSLIGSPPLEVSESGSNRTVSVVLTGRPLTNVVLSVTSGDLTEIAVSPATLTFTSSNWNTAQIVTVTGVDDFIDDGDPLTTVTFSVDDASSDDLWDPLADQTITARTTDNDQAGFTVTQTGGGTTVSENGTTDTFTVVLTSQPTSNVVINVTSGDTGEATVSPGSLTFTPGNWNVTQTVTVTGVDDAIVDGSQMTTITLKVDDANSDNIYDPLPDKTVIVTTTDND